MSHSVTHWATAPERDRHGGGKRRLTAGEQIADASVQIHLPDGLDVGHFEHTVVFQTVLGSDRSLCAQAVNRGVMPATVTLLAKPVVCPARVRTSTGLVLEPNCAR